MKREVVWSIIALFIISGIMWGIGFYISELQIAVYPFIAFGLLLLLITLFRTVQRNKEAVIGLFISLIVVGVIVFFSLHFTQKAYTLDVGAVDEKTKGISSLGPADRISAKHASYIGNEIVTTRDLLSSLVYTDVNVPSKFKYMNVEVRFFDNFPSDGQFLIGLKNGVGWNYSWSKIYDKSLDLSNYSVISSDGMYLYFKGEPAYKSVNEFLSNLPTDKKIAVDNNLITNQLNTFGYEEGNFSVSSRLRGSFELILIAVDTLQVDFTKWDLNGYDNLDTYNVTLTDINGTQLVSVLYEDDGINNKSNTSEKQYTEFRAVSLPLGVYRLKFISNNGDSSISDLWVNQKKVVFNKEVFPIEGFRFYTPDAGLKFQTYHNGKKNLTFEPIESDYSEDDANNTIVADNIIITEVSKFYNYSTNEAKFISSKTGDVAVKSTNYISSNPANYFDPYKYKLLSIKDYDNADYVLVNYGLSRDGNMTTVMTKVPNNGLVYTDKISTILSAKHLDNPNFKNMTIPIDYVKVSYD